ncbi:glycosyltransferase family 4 protein [Halapricum hydrolyticum]|uniref:Glycosyltransferase n=2 Tax=Halapricum hydrolyticum TaxID=2979991 RepID=A0AAE3LES8_9EURY|nr:glycosyltransferase [Halapricum hydrolyticum]MCU4718452.1 glycosyltransferase [Halapricum hydrolyticum]MCU4726435.1 glycosyltransferase [Halapricum hydrolyticum]
MTGRDYIRVGVVGGTRLPGNVRTLLTNIHDLLRDHSVDFDLDLVVSENVDTPDGYTQVDPGFETSNRAIGILKTLTKGLETYARTNDVGVLFQVTKFPLHGSAAILAGRRTSTPVLTRFAGDNFREFKFSSGLDKIRAFGLNNVIGQIPARWSNQIIVLGPHGKQEIDRRSRGVPIREIPQPIDRDLFLPVSESREQELADQLGFSSEDLTLLTVGRLTERKGMETVIKTAKTLSNQGVSFRWYLLGDGPMRPELAATHGVEPLGRVDYEEMPDYYRATDLVVHPSLIEGLPNVLLEAAACDTPTISRNVGDSASVASATFTDDSQLPSIITQQHNPVSLDERFDLERLRDAYADVLLDTEENDI